MFIHPSFSETATELSHRVPIAASNPSNTFLQYLSHDGYKYKKYNSSHTVSLVFGLRVLYVKKEKK